MKDHAVRAITTDGAFRIITLNASDTVRQVHEAQSTPVQVERFVAELVCGAILIRETMSPDFRVQAAVKRKAGGSLFADAHPGGMTRALVSFPEDEELELGEDVLFQVTRPLKNGELHQGVVASRAGAGLSGSLTTYLLTSEQVISVVEVDSAPMNGNAVSGGYIVQLLPGAHEDSLQKITEHLETLPPVAMLLEEASGRPERLLDSVLGPFSGRILEPEIPVFFGCNCSRSRILRALSTIGRSELESIVEEEEELEINCDYCGKSYHFDPRTVAGLI